jgi:beta-glucanase (GH16 family)
MLISLVISITILLVVADAAGFKGWVDVDTDAKHKTTTSLYDGKEYDLVMSDEFNRNGRTFKNGADPMWTAIEKSDDDQTSQGRKSLQYYNASTVSTENGFLVISTNTETTSWKGWNPYLKKYETMTRHFKSGMVQTWNKFCFTGGIIEFDVILPGDPHIGGLWPALWLMGNLGRATFEESTNLMWPWSYEKCNRPLQQAQEISGCDITSHFEMQPGKGRGATEIDILEVMSGPSTPLPFVSNKVRRPYTSMTLQVSFAVSD